MDHGVWNVEPQDAEAHWGGKHARVHDIAVATQKQGRNIDCLIAELRAPTWEVEGCVIAGTDHLGVQLRLRAVDAGTLGVRMEQPTPINIDRDDPEEVERLRGCIAASLPAPPAD